MRRTAFCVALGHLGVLLAMTPAVLGSVSLIHTFDGEAHPGGLGFPARDIGDFNGDGYADFAAYTDESTLNVYYGGASPDTCTDLVFRETDYEGYGSRLAGKCDFNHDGYDDIVLAMGNADNVVLALGGSVPDSQWDLYLTWGLEGSQVFVAAAGRFDGDDYDDIAVSNDSYTQIYLGGDPPDGVPDLTIAHGGHVAGAGDLNNDGYDDMALGIGPTRIYFGGATPDTISDLAIPGTGYLLDVPTCIGGVGDFNGDEYDDLAIGNPYYDSPAVPGSYNGRVVVYYGGSPMDTVGDWMLESISGTSGYLGISVATAGDVDRDGYSDLLVSEPYSNRAYLFYGDEIPASEPGLEFVGQPEDDRFGFEVAGLGDINGDNYDDILITPTTYGVYVRIYLGSESMDSIPDLEITDEEGHQFGYAVSEAGNLNGDAYEDWAIGVPWKPEVGGVYAYHGGALIDTVRDVIMAKEFTFGTYVSSAGDVKNDGYDDLMGLKHGCGGYVWVFFGGSPMDSLSDKRLSSEPYCGDAGTVMMAKGGDFNGDGYDDVLVGIGSFFGPGWTELYYGGAPFNNVEDVYFRSYKCAGDGDVNGDTFADVLTGEPYPWTGQGKAYVYLGGPAVDTIPDPAYTLEPGPDGFGASVAFAGDVNGDTFDDIMVSCSGDLYYEYYEGDVYVFLSGPTMDSIPDIVLANPGSETAFGCAIERLGDINGDLFDDIAVGAPREDNYRGRVYIYYGGNPMDSVPDIVLDGEGAGDRFGFSIAGIGDVNGDGEAEILVGAPGYDDYRGKVYMYAGSRAGIGEEGTESYSPVSWNVGPNPIRDHFKISYHLSESSRVRIELFDVTGRLVGKLADRGATPGDHVLDVDLTDRSGAMPAPGIYFVKLTTGNRAQTAKLVILE